MFSICRAQLSCCPKSLRLCPEQMATGGRNSWRGVSVQSTFAVIARSSRPSVRRAPCRSPGVDHRKITFSPIQSRDRFVFVLFSAMVRLSFAIIRDRPSTAQKEERDRKKLPRMIKPCNGTQSTNIGYRLLAFDSRLGHPQRCPSRAASET